VPLPSSSRRPERAAPWTRRVRPTQPVSLSPGELTRLFVSVVALA
jgi:hypothetical protein